MASLTRRRVQLGLIIKLIERSPIVARGFLPHAAAWRRRALDLPAGYDAIDIFVLDWLAGEAVRGRHKYLPL